MSAITNSGIRDKGDGTSYIPSSRRADGSTRKEIRVRPGYTPQEDVKTYKSRNAEAFRTRGGGGGVPGAEDASMPEAITEPKSKNAKRREAAKKKQALEKDDQVTADDDGKLVDSLQTVQISADDGAEENSQNPVQQENQESAVQEIDAERQKKIRNQVKKLKAVRELKSKKAAGEKLSPDQLVKISKEDELLRDLKKLGYDDTGLAPD